MFETPFLTFIFLSSPPLVYSLPWLIVLLLWTNLRDVIQFCFPVGSQPSDYRAYKGFTDIIVPFKSFRGVAGTIDLINLNHVSEHQAGLSVRRESGRSNVFTCFFRCGYMNVALWCGPGPYEMPLYQTSCFISQTFFGGNVIRLFQLL